MIAYFLFTWTIHQIFIENLLIFKEFMMLCTLTRFLRLLIRNTEHEVSTYSSCLHDKTTKYSNKKNNVPVKVQNMLMFVMAG